MHITQILTSEAHTTSANVSAGHVLAGAAIHTRVGFTLVVVDVAVFAAPARVTQAFIADGEKMLENISDKSYLLLLLVLSNSSNTLCRLSHPLILSSQ